MATELLEIRPEELKFTFELKKQSSCSVQLSNNSNHYVAFKVKTTAPKKYCVRPNIGIVLPGSTSDFTVTMQAQKVAPSDLQCKDKFLVQSTIVPYGTTEEDLSPSLFSKDNGRFIEEIKLRVVLVSPPHSPVLQPINGSLKQEPASISSAPKETSVTRESPNQKEAPLMSISTASHESSISKECSQEGASCIENFYPSNVTKDDTEDGLRANGSDLESKLREDNQVSATQPVVYHVPVDNTEKLSAKIIQLEFKLKEAEKIISELRVEKALTTQEREKLLHEAMLLKRKRVTRVQVGFPLLFVCFVGLVGVAVGYLFSS